MSATDRRYGLIGNTAIKTPCRVCSTANITLSGEQTIDGVAVVTDDRVLVTAQTSSVNNGIYVADTGAWVRSTDMDGTYDIVTGTLVKVNSGTANSGFWYVSTTGTPVIGTDAVDFGMASTVLAVVSAFMQTVLDDTTAAAAAATLGVLPLAGANLTGGLNEARGSIAMHATTMDLFALTSPNVLDGTGAAVTMTAVVNAPQAGARRVLYPPVGSIITNGATFAVDGAANQTAVAGDKWEFEALTINTFKVHVTKKDGTAVVTAFSSSAENIAGTIENKAVDPLGLREAFNCTGSAPVYACRAWVNFNGTGTVAIRASGNVSSITDNNVGDYTVNFTTALPDADYVPHVTRARVNGNGGALIQDGGISASTCRVLVTEPTIGTTEDTAYIFFGVLR